MANVIDSNDWQEILSPTGGDILLTFFQGNLLKAMCFLIAENLLKEKLAKRLNFDRLFRVSNVCWLIRRVVRFTVRDVCRVRILRVRLGLR
jgi:hypothetical protein